MTAGVSSFAAFLRVKINIATRARDTTADNIAPVLVTPFIPIMPVQKKAYDSCPAQCDARWLGPERMRKT